MNLVIETKTAEELYIWVRIVDLVTSSDNITKATAAWLENKKIEAVSVSIQDVLNFLEKEVMR